MTSETEETVLDLEATYQARVHKWVVSCFGEEVAADGRERNHRFLEEALELVQSTGCTASEAQQLVDYVFGRDIGEPGQEVGGVMNTLAALCNAHGLDLEGEAEKELARVWTISDRIRAKHAAKPKHSPLPGALSRAPEALELGSSTRMTSPASRSQTPTHTDLMVSPESLGPWLEKDHGARVICDFMNWPEDGPAWDDARKLYDKLHAQAQPAVCGFCRAEFPSMTAMADHIATSHGPGDRTGQRYRSVAFEFDAREWAGQPISTDQAEAFDAYRDMQADQAALSGAQRSELTRLAQDEPVSSPPSTGGEGEAVAWRCLNVHGDAFLTEHANGAYFWAKSGKPVQPLYLHPSPEMVKITTGQILSIAKELNSTGRGLIDQGAAIHFANAILSKLKENGLSREELGGSARASRGAASPSDCAEIDQPSDLEQTICEALQDSLGPDWSAEVGARYVIDAIRERG